MFQPFSSKASREFKPVQLNNTAQIYDKRGTNFLAFGGPEKKRQVIEYQKADLSQYTAKSAEVPLKINNLKDSPVLDNTFNKRGVFAFKYTDVANPVAYGDDYNIDFGGKDPTAIGFQGKTEREVAEYIKKDMNFTNRYNNLKPKMYGGEKMGGEGQASLSKYNPLKAYSTYGYRQSMDWSKDEDFVADAMALNVRKKEKASYVMDIDKNVCSEGSVVVNGECIPLNDSARYCPEGYEYIKGLGCQKKHHKNIEARMNDINVNIEHQKGQCLPGWEFKNGLCQVKELNTAEPVGTDSDDSKCNYTLGILLGVIVVIGLGAVASKAFQQDNKPRV